MSTINADYQHHFSISNDDTKLLARDGEKNGYGLKIIDVSDASSPVDIALIDTPNYVISVYLSEDNTKAYVLEDEGLLQIIDVSVPFTPTILSSVSLS